MSHRTPVIRSRDERVGVSEDKRARRSKALRALVTRMDGQDVEAELARLKEEDGIE